MRRSTGWWRAGLLLGCIWRGVATAATVPTGAPILQMPIGSRATGMGGAFSAVSDDDSAIHWNPAGLALLERQQLSTMFIQGLSDVTTEFVGYGRPLSIRGVRLGLGASALYSQLGRIDIQRTNPDGSFRDQQSISAGSDALLSLALAVHSHAELQGLDVELPESYLGLSARYLKSTLAEQYSAYAYAADLGYLGVWREGLRVAFVIQNMGGGIKFVDSPDPLPLTYRLGLAWQRAVPMISATPLTLSVEGTEDRDKKGVLHTGMEFWYKRTMAYRVGYQYSTDLKAFSTGIGLRFGLPGAKGGESFLLDYGIVPVSTTGGITQNVTLSFEFGRSL